MHPNKKQPGITTHPNKKQESPCTPIRNSQESSRTTIRNRNLHAPQQETARNLHAPQQETARNLHSPQQETARNLHIPNKKQPGTRQHLWNVVFSHGRRAVRGSDPPGQGANGKVCPVAALDLGLVEAPHLAPKTGVQRSKLVPLG